ncbi:MAG TPA: S9 family peptidase, partial [Terriglobia bacterium]|nr:S9 family peptidase [Terriglobia bacterium]
MRFRVSLVLMTTLLVSFGAFGQKRSITEKDLFDFTWVGDPQVAPDGSRVVFVRVGANDKRNGYNTSLWVVSTTTGDVHQLTNNTRDSAPRWSPDGKYLAFVRVTEKDGKPDQPQLFMMNMAGGESFRFTSLPKGVTQPAWSPDGKSIAFLSTTNPEDARRTDSETDHESDVRVITRAVYRSNDAGYLDPRRPMHLWVVQVPRNSDDKVSPKQLTTGRFSEGSIVWAKDGSQIYFTSVRIDEPYYELPKTDIYALPAAGGEPVRLTTLNMEARAFALSPNGRQLAFIGSTTQPINSYSQPDLWVIDLMPGAKPRNVTAGFDYDVGAGVSGDNDPPRAAGANVPIWTADGGAIVEVYAKEGKANLGLFETATGKLAEITRGNQAVIAFRATPDGSKLVYTVSTPTRIGDLFYLERSAAQPKRLASLNDAVFSNINLTEPEEVWYTSFDGKRIQAWLQKPPAFDAQKKYPLILDIHGGPHTAYGYVFDHEFQWMAAKGYVVLYPNPRGSTSYGQEFGNIIQYRYPGDDYKDLMAGVDEVIKRGYIDTNKLGVTGGSGGGLLTNWTIGQTTRFAAAVSQRDIANWADWWYSADFTLFQPNWFKAPPFEDPEDYKARSPITYIKNVKTPL